MTFEALLAEAHGRYADGVDADVPALDLAAAIATGSRRGRLSSPRVIWLVGPGCAPQQFLFLQSLPEVSQ